MQLTVALLLRPNYIPKQNLLKIRENIAMSSRITRYQGNFKPGFYKNLHRGPIEKNINKYISKKKCGIPKIFKEILEAINYNIANLLAHRRSSPVRVFHLFITKKLLDFFQSLGLNNRFKISTEFLMEYKLKTCRFFNSEDYSEIVDNSFKLKITTKKPLSILNRDDLTVEKINYPPKLCCKFTVKKRVLLI